MGNEKQSTNPEDQIGVGSEQSGSQPQDREWEIQVRTAETFTAIVRAPSALAAEERAKQLVLNPPNDGSEESVTAWCDRKIVRIIDANLTSLDLYP